MQSITHITGTILDELLPPELRVDTDKLLSISTNSDFTGSANRYRELLGKARQIYSNLFFEADFAHRAPPKLLFTQYYISRRDWAQSALQLYTSARNSRIPVKRLPFGAELIEELKSLNEIVDVLTDRVTVEKPHRDEAIQKMQDDLAKEVKRLIKKALEAAGVKNEAELTNRSGKASEGLASQRILSSGEVGAMLGNIVVTAESVKRLAGALLGS